MPVYIAKFYMENIARRSFANFLVFSALSNLWPAYLFCIHMPSAYRRSLLYTSNLQLLLSHYPLPASFWGYYYFRFNLLSVLYSF